MTLRRDVDLLLPGEIREKSRIPARLPVRPGRESDKRPSFLLVSIVTESGINAEGSMFEQDPGDSFQGLKSSNKASARILSNLTPVNLNL